jgi:hypothetical protein
MSIATPEQVRVIYQAYRRVYKRMWSKRHWAETHKADDRTQGIVIHKEDRKNHTVEHCQCGCGMQLTDKRYTEHYQTRECFIHRFHVDYHERLKNE